MNTNLSALLLGAPSRVPIFLRAGFALLLLTAPLVAQTPVAASFTAGRGSWFDDINWSGGTFPGPNTAALVDGASVRLNARGLAEPFVIRSLTLINGAECELRDVRLHADLIATTNSLLRIVSSHLVVGTFRDPLGFSLNPSLLEAQDFELAESNTTASFGLGGTNPATATGLGAGHYARVVCDAARLAGNLDVQFLHGFAPQAGQQFAIIQFNGSGPITGQFGNAPEGALVTRYNNLGLYITYAGGDGNDVVLTVQTLPTTTAPLVHATRSGNWFDPGTWSDGQVPAATKEHVLLARQVTMQSATPGQTVNVKSLTLLDGAELIVSNLTLTAELLAATNSSLRIFSSHLVVGTFRDPFGGFQLNPSLVEAQRFELVASNTTASFGLGGANPAAANARGAGHYARVVCDTAHLDGNLEVPFLYGFAPQAGQQFKIIEVTSTSLAIPGLTGAFVNAPEGALVTRYNNLGLYITYAGGDGNDVVLTVQPLPVTVAPLVHATRDGDWFDPAVWSDGQVPTATKEHVLFARQITMQSAAPGQTVTVKSLTLLAGSELIVSNLTLTAELIATTNSLLRIVSSHLVVGAFRDPGFGSFSLNPSLLEAQSFELVETNTTATFGLGGANPATATGLGAGHYARVVCESARLDGNLAVQFLYGFAPQAGQQFELIRNNGRTPTLGRFANVREGGAVAVFGDLMLVLSYVGGDGNDLVLTAVPRPSLALTKELTGTLVLSYPTARGHFYTVETTTDLGTGAWSPLPVVFGAGAPQTLTVTNSGARRFHRLFGDSNGD